MSNTSKVLLAFVAGAVAGAVAGVLFAPDRGDRTRARLADSTNDLLYKAKRQARKVANGISEVVA
jgi:gas vesicle protein